MNDRQFRILAVLLGVIGLLLLAILVWLALGGDEGGTAVGTSTTAAVSSTDPADPSTTTLLVTSTTATPTTATSTTSSTTSTSTTSTSTTTTTVAPLVLEADGIGAVDFGADPDTAIAYATAALGPPKRDSGWIDSFSGYGTCPPPVVRGVEWGGPADWYGFVLLFTQAATSYQPAGVPHLFGYYYIDGTDPAGLGTPEAIFIGSSIADAQAAYPGLQLFDDEVFGTTWRVDDDPSDDAILYGSASGTDPADIIETINGGVTCGE